MKGCSPGGGGGGGLAAGFGYLIGLKQKAVKMEELIFLVPFHVCAQGAE